MRENNEADYIDKSYIDSRIKRAHSGISYIKVVNSGRFYAILKQRSFTYFNQNGEYKGSRNLRASKIIFKQLIDRYQNFECDGIYYYVNRNTGKWLWLEKV